MSQARIARDRAAEWLVAREQGEWTDRDQAALDAWLGESDLNKAAFWRLEHSWSQADRLAALGRGAAVTEGLARSGHPSARGWRHALTALAASVVIAVGIGLYGTRPIESLRSKPAAGLAATQVGGHRLLGLSDGSRVELNTDTRVRTLVAGNQRSVWLDKGEAFFEVAHREGQPFVVHAGPRAITVLGTKFSVRRDGDKVTVSVLEGRVRVDDVEHGGTARSTIIAAGDIALSEGTATLVTTGSKERVDAALSWREGMLSFDQELLPEIAAEFNRYNRKKIVIEGPEAMNIRIGGTFPASRPGAFARLLRDAYALEVEESQDMVKISR
jgi:transmembrane sensor